MMSYYRYNMPRSTKKMMLLNSNNDAITLGAPKKRGRPPKKQPEVMAAGNDILSRLGGEIMEEIKTSNPEIINEVKRSNPGIEFEKARYIYFQYFIMAILALVVVKIIDEALRAISTGTITIEDIDVTNKTPLSNDVSDVLPEGGQFNNNINYDAEGNYKGAIHKLKGYGKDILNSIEEVTGLKITDRLVKLVDMSASEFIQVIINNIGLADIVYFVASAFGFSARSILFLTYVTEKVETATAPKKYVDSGDITNLEQNLKDYIDDGILKTSTNKINDDGNLKEHVDDGILKTEKPQNTDILNPFDNDEKLKNYSQFAINGRLIDANDDDIEKYLKSLEKLLKNNKYNPEILRNVKSPFSKSRGIDSYPEDLVLRWYRIIDPQGKHKGSTQEIDFYDPVKAMGISNKKYDDILNHQSYQPFNPTFPPIGFNTIK